MMSFWQGANVRLRAVEPEDAEHLEPSILLHEKLGFTREGTLRRMVYTHGHYVDEIWFGMTAGELQAQRR